MGLLNAAWSRVGIVGTVGISLRMRTFNISSSVSMLKLYGVSVSGLDLIQQPLSFV